MGDGVVAVLRADEVVLLRPPAAGREVVDRRAPFAPPKAMRLKALGRIKPSAEEVARNPRARSAILRVAERTSTPTTPAPAGARRS